MKVSEADRIKAVERVRAARAPIFGGTPSFKRKRGIWRALKRGDFDITTRFNHELGMLRMMRSMVDMFYGRHYEMVTKPCGLLTLLKDEER